MKTSKKQQQEILKKRLVTIGLIIIIVFCWTVIGIKISIGPEKSKAEGLSVTVPSMSEAVSPKCGDLLNRVSGTSINIKEEIANNNSDHAFCSDGYYFQPKDAYGQILVKLYAGASKSSLSYDYSLTHICLVNGKIDDSCVKKLLGEAYFQWQCCPEGSLYGSSECATCSIKREQPQCMVNPGGQPTCFNGEVATTPKPVKVNGQWVWTCLSWDAIPMPQLDPNTYEWKTVWQTQVVPCAASANITPVGNLPGLPGYRPEPATITVPIIKNSAPPAVQ